MIANLYSFDSDVKPISIKGILYNLFEGGTKTQKVFDNILKTKRPSMIITDADDKCDLAKLYNESQLKTITDNTFMTVLSDRKYSNKNIFRDGSCNYFYPLIKAKKYAYINTKDAKLYQALKLNLASFEVITKEL